MTSNDIQMDNDQTDQQPSPPRQTIDATLIAIATLGANIYEQAEANGQQQDDDL